MVESAHITGPINLALVFLECAPDVNFELGRNLDSRIAGAAGHRRLRSWAGICFRHGRSPEPVSSNEVRGVVRGSSLNGMDRLICVCALHGAGIRI